MKHVNIPVIVLGCTECVRYAFNRVNDRAGEVVCRVCFVLTACAVMGGVIEPGVHVVKGDGGRVRGRVGKRKGKKVRVVK